MKKYKIAWVVFSVFPILVVGTIWLLFRPSRVYARTASDEVSRGGALYDNWWAALGKQAPDGNMPLWDRQSTNTRTGPDTWRCVTCHGWDYQGKDGAYRSGSNYTGFPGVYQAGQAMVEDEIIRQLDGSRDPSHDFSPYLTQADLFSLAKFITSALTNDTDFIDPVSYKVLDGNPENGKKLFDEQCAVCHGKDGAEITFRFEGLNASLGTLATQDPWRFLHKSRFGTPGTEMVIGYDLGWTAQDGRDVLKYAQSLPTGQETTAGTPVMTQRTETAPRQSGGPATSIFSAILTAFSVMAAGLGFNIIVGAALAALFLLLVWAISSHK